MCVGGLVSLGRRGTSPKGSPPLGPPEAEEPPPAADGPPARSGMALSALSRAGSRRRCPSNEVLYESGSTGHTTHGRVTSHGWTETMGRVRARLRDAQHEHTSRPELLRYYFLQNARRGCMSRVCTVLVCVCSQCTLGEMGPGRGPKPGLMCWAGLASNPEALAHNTLGTAAF